MKTKTNNQLISLLIALYVFIAFMFTACCGNGDDDFTNTQAPSSVTIQKITVTNWPSNDGISTWDICVGLNCIRPDIYPVIKYESTTILDLVNEAIENVSTGENYSFSISNLVITEPKIKHLFRLYDEDGATEDDLMGQVSVAPFSTVNGRSNPIIISGDGITMELQVTYQD
ncbi:hypothetical protein R3X25_00235 [Lutibacter sp. TH_r2]|uniref:hypothetical protein n=1 Tax=Lutibacter sp. TH_r2 TaxID=3082083 RepID=UPI002953776F|nr:hypothetical protein [Lutibacter sp. TH_r2]MDV7185691.1 hypothetical protein [Lutibacter sp. TH_r2]